MRTTRWTHAVFAWLSCALICVCNASELEQAFQTPPETAKPITWWHWIDGNVTKKGITGDLEAMKRAGVGGCYLFTIGGYFPEGPAKFGTPGWFELLDHTVKEADRLGLVFGMHNCDGWSEAGGPWITVENSMKLLTYSKIDVEGGKRIEQILPQPVLNENFYRDIAVVAFPIPSAQRLNMPDTRVTGSLKKTEIEKLSDGKIETRTVFPVSKSGHQIQFELPQPATIRSMRLKNVAGYTVEEDFPACIESSVDGKTWNSAGKFSFCWDTHDGVKPITVGLDEHDVRFLRISFTNLWQVEIGEIEVSDAARVHFAEAKAGWLRRRGHGGEADHYKFYPGPDRHRDIPRQFVLSKKDVIDLTSQVRGGSNLVWNVPSGKWRILRVGYTTNGKYIHPASSAGRGFECDKLDSKVVRSHLDHYIGKLAERFGPATGKVFVAVETDSWECDVQNWTAGLEKRFKKEIEIDIVPWFPLLLEGWVTENADVSERVLWDWRRFLADQFAENFFSVVGKYLRSKGLQYISEGSGRQMYLYDPIGYQRYGDVPMGEFWLNKGPGQGVRADNKVASSVAHITGRRIVASESYTASAPYAAWQNHPYSLKPLGDRAFCAGVNRFVFHSFAHQPYEMTGPGFTMAVWGLNFNRANTWWEPGRAWLGYLARCNHLLQEGRFAADVLWFIGEDVPNRIAGRDELDPVLPNGYDFDACDAIALCQAKVKNGRIVLPSGMEYRVLLLANRATMRPETVRAVERLVQDGAVVVGRPPEQSPSLSDLGRGDREVQKLASRIWGPCDGKKALTHEYGKGRVFCGLSFPEIFERLKLTPDFDYTAETSDSEVLYIHRRIDDADFYFVANQQSRFEAISARFRVTDRQPEIWDPVTGSMSSPALFEQTPSGTELKLTLDPAGSVFVVFRHKVPIRRILNLSGDKLDCQYEADGSITARSWNNGGSVVELSSGFKDMLVTESLPAPLELSGPWQVRFPAGLGAPDSAVFEKLVSWTQSPDKGIRYFSGTATYTKEFDLSSNSIATDHEFWLDLGNVEVIAEVRLNDQQVGILWKPPFRANVTSAIKPGKNRLEIRVTNLWPNRMIGDEELPEAMPFKAKGRPLPTSWPEWFTQGKPRPDGRITTCTRKAYKKGDPLLDSGLIGPVHILCAKKHKL